MADLSRAPRPKPWERPSPSPAASNGSDVPVSSSVAQSATYPTDNTNTEPRVAHIGGQQGPRLPPRPSEMTGYGGMTQSGAYPSRYGGYGGYGATGSTYGSGYGSGSAYGSSYGGGYGSSYGGYGSSYGGYGSSYGGGYGSSYGGGYGGYGSSLGSSYPSRYGGYGGYASSYGRGQFDGNGPQGMGGTQGRGGLLEGGAQQLHKFGMVIDSFSRFSRLMDANFDALHGSFSSVLRLMDVFAEFLFVLRTFALFKFLFGGVSRMKRVMGWLLGRPALQRIANGQVGVELANDYRKFQSDQKRKRVLPIALVLLGLTCVSAPMLLARIARFFRRQEGMETAWGGEEREGPPPMMARAKYPFQGETNMDLPFQQGDVMQIISQKHDGWWEAEINGKRGLVPATHLDIIEGQQRRDQRDSPNS